MQNSIDSIIVDGKTINVTINRKTNVKRLNFRIRDNELIISCPVNIKDEEIKKAVEQDRIKRFVREHIVFDEDVLHQVHLFGKAYQLSLLEDKREYVKVIGDLIIIHYKKDITIPLYAFYKEELEKYVLSIYDKALEDYKLTKKAPKLSYKIYKARHAEYNRVKHEIVINIGIAKYDKEFIKAVLYHELAHVFYFNHSVQFYALLEKKYPGYKEYMKKQKSIKYADKY